LRYTNASDLQAIRWAADEGADIISMSFGWEEEHHNKTETVVLDAIAYALGKRHHNLLFFAAASNYGGGHSELFPACSSTVFSIRATDADGVHEHCNPELVRDEWVVGTLGAGVPTKEKDHREIGRTGTSVATAVSAGLAAIVIGYINIHGDQKSRGRLRTHDGFKKLLAKSNWLSTEPRPRQRFFTLQKIFGPSWQSNFEKGLDGS
jgi:subtilisin family serine protease